MFDELTQVDIDKMNKEIEERIKLRPALSEDVLVAKSYGDLSENAEYHEAKRKKNQNEGRIAYLRNMIKTAKIVEQNKNPDEVGLFDKVTILFEDDGEEQVVTLSTIVRIDATNGIISKESPLGKAIFGHKKGERIFVNVSQDMQYYVVIKDIQKGQDDSSIPLNKF